MKTELALGWKPFRNELGINSIIKNRYKIRKIYTLIHLCLITILLFIPVGAMDRILDNNSFDNKNYIIDQIDLKFLDYINNGMNNLSELSDNEIVEFPATGSEGYSKTYNISIQVKKLKHLLKERMDFDNPFVRQYALDHVSGYSGYLTIEHICSIYRYLRFGNSSTRGWIYISDPIPIDEYYSYANETMRLGVEIKCSGVGDCDDFAILQSALIQSLGGTTRIVLAFNETSGHAFTEVYLGNMNNGKQNIHNIAQWLGATYNQDIIYAERDAETNDVWLSLDWFSAFPGGAIRPANLRVIVNIDDNPKMINFNIENKTEPLVISTDVQSKYVNLSISDSPEDWIRTRDPSDAQSWVNEGIRFNYIPDYPKAIACFNKALRLNLNHAQAWNDKGYALSHLYRFEEALDCYKNASKIDPLYIKPLYNGGLALYKMGRYEESLELFENAINLDPQNAGSWYGKSIALEALGYRNESKIAYDKASQYDPITYF